MAGDILKKLKNSNIDDLKSLNSLDLKSFLKSNLDVALNVFVVVLSLFLVGKFWNDFGTQKNNLLVQIADNEKKLIEVNRYLEIQGRYDSLVKNFPAFVSREDLPKRISEMTSKYDMQLDSISSVRTETTTYYDSVVVSVSLNAGSFKDIAYFINEIESKLDLMLVTSVQIGAYQNSGRAGKSDALRRINANIVVQSLKLKQ